MTLFFIGKTFPLLPKHTAQKMKFFMVSSVNVTKPTVLLLPLKP